MGERDDKPSVGGGLLTLPKTDAGALPTPTQPSRPVNGTHITGSVGGEDGRVGDMTLGS